MADLVGRKLGQYEIRGVIGRGGMATVYRAYQPALNRYVAIKVLNAVMSHDAEFVTRFHREALTAGSLDHPNILRIYDAGVFEDHQYIVMALAPGGSLSDKLQQSAMPYNAAADLIAQVSDALDYAHRHKIVHRDIKPSNILLDDEGRPLLADFGIAQALASAEPRMTIAGASIGTPDYMSPEQAEGDLVDGRSDLFSLGIALYQMATGQLPFKAETTLATMFQVVHHTPPAPRLINPTIPAYLDSIIQKALAKRPKDRFQSGQEMAQALRQRAVVPVPPPSAEWDQMTQAVRSTTRRSATDRPLARQPRPANRRLLAFTFFALAVVAVLAASYVAVSALNRRAGRVSLASMIAAPATTEPTAAPTELLPEATAEVKPAATRGGGVIVARSPSPEAPAATDMPASTQTPVVVVITVMATLPATEAPTVAAETATRAPTATKPLAQPVAALATAAPLPPGTVLNFESFGNWRIGNEPHGAFTQSNEQKHDGQFAAKLAYRFPAVNNNYVVFRRSPLAAIPGRPPAVSLWVYGDGSGHFLNIWVRDSGAEVRQFTFGRVTHTGWQQMIAALDPNAPWPQGHISGLDNGQLDYPVSADAFVLDGVPDGGGPFSGVIYLDELRTADAAPAPESAPQRADTGAMTDAAAPTDEAPAAVAPVDAGALGGRIVYPNAGGGVSVLDVVSRNSWELFQNARQPDVTRDGRVAVNGAGGGRDNLWVIRLDGSANWMAGMHPEDSYPSWSASGVSVAFHSSLQGDGKDRIYIQRDMGHAEEPRRLQINKTDVYGKYATWLENWRIAFTGCNYWAEGSRCGIWTTNSNDSGAPVLVSEFPTDVSSDDANGILLFASQRTGNWDIYSVGVNGGAPRNLTNSPAQDFGAAFSPDGRFIAFMSNRDGWGIWAMSADGGAAQKLLAVPGFGANWTEERLSWAP